MPLLIVATLAIVILMSAAAASLAEPGGLSGTVIFDPTA